MPGASLLVDVNGGAVNGGRQASGLLPAAGGVPPASDFILGYEWLRSKLTGPCAGMVLDLEGLAPDPWGASDYHTIVGAVKKLLADYGYADSLTVWGAPLLRCTSEQNQQLNDAAWTPSVSLPWANASYRQDSVWQKMLRFVSTGCYLSPRPDWDEMSFRAIRNRQTLYKAVAGQDARCCFVVAAFRFDGTWLSDPEIDSYAAMIVSCNPYVAAVWGELNAQTRRLLSKLGVT